MQDKPPEKGLSHEAVIDIWKQIVAVQMHFNEISMRIRGMFVTLLLAFFAAMGFLIDKDMYLNVLGLQIQFAILVSIFAIFATWLFYFIDRYWYHRLLTGSVKHAIGIENKYKAEIPELSLSEAIGIVSPVKPRGFTSFISWAVVSHDKYREKKELHSDGKIELFYKAVMLVLLVAAILLALAGGIRLGTSRSDVLHPSSSDEEAPVYSAPPVEDTPPAGVPADPAPVEDTPSPPSTTPDGSSD